MSTHRGRLYVRGGGSWTIACSGGRVYVNGWVRDNRANGLCGQVYALMNNGWHQSNKACPLGTTKAFYFYSPTGNSASVYLREIP